MPSYHGQLASELENYQNLGIHQGRQNLPSTNSISPDESEIKLSNKALHYLLDEKKEFNLRANELSQRLAELDTKLIETQAKSEALLTGNITAKSEANGHLAPNKLKLAALKEEELALLADLNGFKALNRITWLAHYPQDYLHHLSWIFLCVALETLINAFFYENERGLLGGAVVALAISFVNIGLAGVLGYFFRYSNHIDLGAKVLGWFCLAVFFIETIFLNAVFSTFRTAFQQIADPGNVHETKIAFEQALSEAGTIFTLHIPFSDILSFTLFFVGCLLCLYALYKGYTFDDPYPGHGDRDQRYNAARSRYHAGEDELRKEVQILLEKRRLHLESARSLISEIGSQCAIIDGKIVGLANDFQANIQRIAGDYKLVIDSYRKSNAAVRATQSPTYFQEIINPAANITDNRSAGLLQLVAGLKQRYETLRSSCTDRLASRIQEETIQVAEILGTHFGKFSEEVRILAEERISSRRITIGADVSRR